ncbi:MAG TPA: N-acetylmuramoyl-L-alanine amidase [Acidobacteriaceae bacterium]|nr:N-acetylmuramoyl-L-alanine amidase [Acidobacteriaceae bacterium]
MRVLLRSTAWGILVAGMALPPRALAAARTQYGSPQSSFAHAERLREALEGRPERDRIHLDYERVLDAYRAIYHNNPSSPRADDSIAAVADLLAEEGRVFHDQKALYDALGQYEFLRHEYPYSHFRFSALITEGEIYQRDLGDLKQARKIYESFLRQYAEHPLAVEARKQLKAIQREEWAAKHHRTLSTTAQSAPPVTQTPPIRAENELEAQQAREAAARARNTQPAASPGGIPSTNERLPSTTTLSPQRSQELASTNRNEVEAANFHPPATRIGLPLITGIRHWSTPVYTRVAIDLQQQVRYTAARVPNPDRIYFDLYGAKLSPELVGRSVEVTGDDFLTRIRVLQFAGDRVRVVLDVNSLSDYSAFFLANPSRLIVDVHGHRGGAPVQQARTNSSRPTIGAGIGIGPVNAQPPAQKPTFNQPAPQPSSTGTIRAGLFPDADGRVDSPTALSDVAKLSRTPEAVKATRHPTTAPVVASVSATKTANTSATWPRPSAAVPMKTATSRTPRAEDDVPPAAAGVPGVAAPEPGRAPSTMMRALGLKINRIVIDAGHGGHDSGTLGPGGLEEKDVVLDVALRLGKLLRQRLGAEVTYTRSDDTFVPLETRTAMANQAQADLFISIHANSSPDTTARGVEVYYLNFTSSADALEVAARENASSDESIHQLSDLVKKIALQDKVNESREFATDVDESLYSGLETGNPGLRDRGVKKAPFVVLIGANMPSILAEISFLTNPDDAHELRESRYRQRIAESLYRGVAHYVDSMNGVRVARAGN